MKHSRRLAGARAQRNGDVFEKNFMFQCQRRNVAITRIPNGCIMVNRKLIQVKSPFDWVLTFRGKAVVVDTKTAAEPTLRNSAIERHQVLHLMNHAVTDVPAGYVVWTRKNDCVWFIDVHTLARQMHIHGSMNPQEHGHKILGNSSDFDPRHLFYSKGVFHAGD